MATTQNTALRNLLVDAFCAVFNGGTVELRTAASGGGTLLASISLPNPAFGAASGGSANKNGVWSDTSADASGVAAFARFKSSDGLKIVDMTVTAVGGGGDIEIDNVNIVAGGVVTISSFTYVEPA